MTGGRAFLVGLMVCLLLAVPGTGLAAQSSETVSLPTEASLETGTGSGTEDQTAPYHHYDCTGPASSSIPGSDRGEAALAGGHEPNPHTAKVDGFTFNPFTKIEVTIVGLYPAMSGLCPASADGPALGDGFSGRYHVRVTCSEGTNNPGTVTLDLVAEFHGGVPIDEESDSSGACWGDSGDRFTLEVTVGIKRPGTGYKAPFHSYWTSYGTGGVEIWVEQRSIWA